ncbi:MAG: YjbH domain-containing protein [Chlamydiota bacterium]|nr:YjbH domain-containing protein [Chlamydiota bacterium]
MKYAIPQLLTVLILSISQAYTVEYSCIDRSERLMDDLMIAEYWSCKNCERFPVFYNHLLQGGYINMPSAQMGREGEIALGVSWVPPYHNWNVRTQVLDRLELTLNYRVFRGVDDPVLSELGFGDFSDKGANLKFAIFRAEDSNYSLPGLAIGLDDFLGTRGFKSRYLVATKVFLDHNFEASVGIGEWRIRGIFGGISWMPFRRCPDSFFSELCLNAEYDAIPYKSEKREPHPDGRTKNSPINLGIKWRLWKYFDVSGSWIRGDEFAFSASAFYNFGTTKGFVSKVDDPLPYRSPVNTQATGSLRPENIMIQELIYAFRDQGIDITEAWIWYDKCNQKVLRLTIYNNNYRFEYQLKERLDYLTAYLIPEDIDAVNITITSEGFPIQEYRYFMPYVRRFGGRCMGKYELDILTPLCETSYPKKCVARQLYHCHRNGLCFSVLPDFRSYFGSTKGKFKFSFGLNPGFDGFTIYDIYYSFRAGYLLFSDLDHVQGVDRLNPSQIINVKTDLPLYLKQRGITFPELYLRKIWNMGKGWYSKLAGGYFERQYGGFATEFLYYPVRSRWAFGIEGAFLMKRNHTGFGFTDQIRKFQAFTPFYKHFIGSQYFANIYYDCKDFNTEFHLKAGQFLARDFGIRYEVSRYFESGMRLTAWYTRTNGHDKINNETYYDKGVMISLPLDIFYTCSSRKKWRYGMSAWLRDVGVYSLAGGDIYTLINDQRQN